MKLTEPQWYRILEIHRRARTVQNISVFNTFSSWIVLYWAVLSCVELCWIALSCIETYWTPIELYWLVLNSAELSCMELVWTPIELYWPASKSAELRLELQAEPDWASKTMIPLPNYPLPYTIYHYHLPLPTDLQNEAAFILNTLHTCTHSKQYSETRPPITSEE